MVEPEIEEILEEAVATVKVLSPAAEPDNENRDGSILGPMLIAKVQVVDETVEALLYTGSLVTILSLNFIVISGHNIREKASQQKSGRKK